MNYFDMLMGELTGAGMPDSAATRSMASQGEDARLRSLMGSRRKKRKGEHLPSGEYAAAWYPGLDYQMWAMKRGMGPAALGMGAARIGMDRDEKMAYRNKMEEWANAQRNMLATVPELRGRY